MVKKIRRKKKMLSIFKDVTVLIPPLSNENGTNTTRKNRQSSQLVNSVNTKKVTPSTSRSSKHTKKDEKIDIQLHAEMFKTSCLILREVGYCQQGKMKSGDYVIVLSKELWNEDLSIKPRK